MDLFNDVPRNSILVSYHGQFDMRTIDMLLKTVKVKLDEMGVDKYSSKSIYNVSVECLENVLKHGKPNQNNGVEGKVAYSFMDDQLCIVVANQISQEDKEILEERLKGMDELSVDRIKDVYKRDLINGKISDRGGAGLGMYVMAMKSNKNYDYQIVEDGSGEGGIYYALKVNIGYKVEPERAIA